MKGKQFISKFSHQIFGGLIQTLSYEAVRAAVIVTPPFPRDGGLAEDHGAPEAGQFPRAWTSGRRDSVPKERTAQSP